MPEENFWTLWCKWRKKNKWQSIRCKQSKDIYSAKINKWIKSAVLPIARTGQRLQGKIQNLNVVQYPTWWSPCRMYVAPCAQCLKVWLVPTAQVLCSNATKIRERKTWSMQSQCCTWQNFVPGQEPPKMGFDVLAALLHGPISAAGGSMFTIFWRHLQEILLLNKFFFLIVDTFLTCKDIVRQSSSLEPRWQIFDYFCVLYLQRAACRTFQTGIWNSH